MSTEPKFVVRSANPNYKTPDVNTNNIIETINYYLSLSPSNTINPNSELYKLAIKQYNDSLKGSLVRPPIPKFFCGKVDATTGQLTIDLTDYNSRLTAGLVVTPLQISITEVPQLSGAYRVDNCLKNGLPGSYAYTLCQANGSSLSDGTYTAFSTTTTEPSAIINTTGKVSHATTFLRDNASSTKTTLNIFSTTYNDAMRNEVISFNKTNGYTVFYLMAASKSPHSNILYTASDKAFWRSWMNKVIQSGSRIVMWMRTDDSPELDAWSAQKFEDYCRLIYKDLGDLISEYVIGLECNEYWSMDTTSRFVNFLRNLSGKKIGVHTSSTKHIDYAKVADVYYLQTGFDTSVSDIKSKVSYAINYLNKPVIAAEYAKSGETQSAKNLGNAAIDAGAVGVGNGCTSDRIQK